MYSSELYEFNNFNFINIDDPQLNTKYYVRVEAIYNVQFDITAYYGSVAPVLSAGHFTVDSVMAGQCNQYIAYVSANANQTMPDVSLDFIESVGDVQMYVSFTAAPNSSHWDLTSGSDPTSRTGHVGVDTSQLSQAISSSGTLTLYVAVCGVTASTYSLSYTTNSIYLPINQPLTARTPVNTSQPLYFFVQSQVVLSVGQASNLSLSVLGTKVDGSGDAWGAQFTLYMCNDQIVSCLRVMQPNMYNSPWNYTLTNRQVLILPQNTTASSSGTYVFALYSNVGGINIVLQVAQRTSNVSRLLADGERVVGETLELSSSWTTDYYQTRVMSANTACSIQVDVCQGGAYLFISEANAFPSNVSYQIRTAVG